MSPPLFGAILTHDNVLIMCDIRAREGTMTSRDICTAFLEGYHWVPPLGWEMTYVMNRMA